MGCRIGHAVGLDRGDGNCSVPPPANCQRAVVVLIYSVRAEKRVTATVVHTLGRLSVVSRDSSRMIEFRVICL